MLGDLLRELLGIGGGAAKPATQAAKKAGSGAARGIGGAGKMNPNNTPVGKAMQMQPQKQFKMYEDNSFQGDPREFMGKNPGFRFFEDNTFMKTFPRQPRYEDDGLMAGQQGYSPVSADIANWQRPQFGGVQAQGNRFARTGNPMDFDAIPNNFTAGRTGYYQGSNPYLNNIDDLDYKLRVR